MVDIFESVLLIEDDPAHALLIKRALRGYCEEVEHADRFEQAIQSLSERQPDLIITDLHLPDASAGVDVERLRRQSGDRPIIVLTSSTSLKTAVDAMKKGARDYIVKNFDGDFREALALSLSRVFAAMRLEEEARKLQKELAVLRVAIENSNDGLAVTDAQGQVQYANRSFNAFARRCGSSGTSMEGLFGSDVKDSERLAQTVREKRDTLADGAFWSTEVELPASEKGQAYDFSLSVIDERGDQPGPGGRSCVVWVRDVSEMKRREKFQREILSTTSHDLKGPLGAISISSELILELAEKESKIHQIALRIGSSAQGAINLIEEFLSARRLQEGNFILKPQINSVSEMIQEVGENYVTIAAAKGVEFSTQCQADVEWRIDRLGFERAVGNLLSNALKFTPRGGRVWLSARTGPQGLMVEVGDTGSGMEPADVQQIFDRFSRLEKHANVEGSGLGLYVVKSIVTAHDGKIEVTSRPGKGTVFHLNFPANPPVNEHGELIALDFA